MVPARGRRGYRAVSSPRWGGLPCAVGNTNTLYTHTGRAAAAAGADTTPCLPGPRLGIPAWAGRRGGLGDYRGIRGVRTGLAIRGPHVSGGPSRAAGQPNDRRGCAVARACGPISIPDFLLFGKKNTLTNFSVSSCVSHKVTHRGCVYV